MKLELKGIEVKCILGDRPAERKTPRKITVAVVLEGEFKAAKTDRLEDTVDYAEVVEQIRATLIKAKCRMIERAARLVKETCLKFKGVKRAEVAIAKAGAIPHLGCAIART